jgi:hypothetical protein
MAKKNHTEEPEDIQDTQPEVVEEPDYKVLYLRSLAVQDNVLKRQ